MIYLSQIDAYIDGTGETTLRYCSGTGYLEESIAALYVRSGEHGSEAMYQSSPNEPILAPNVPSVWLPRIVQPANLRRDIFERGTTGGSSRVGIGELILSNPDGALDALIDYGFDGRRVIIWYGPDDGEFSADFVRVFTGTVEQATFEMKRVTFKLRDRQYELQTSIQNNLYAGTNVIPLGLEGLTDIQGKPKPLTFGTRKNVTAVCVNTAKLIYRVHDGEVHDIPAVYDMGKALRRAVTGYWDRVSYTLGGYTANRVIYDSASTKIFFDSGAAAGSRLIGRYNTSTHAYEGSIIVSADYGESPVGVCVCGYDDTLWYSIVGGPGAVKDIRRYNTTSNTFTKTVSVPWAPGRLAYSDVSECIYVMDTTAANQVRVYDLATDLWKSTISLGTFASSCTGMEYSAATGYLYVSGGTYVKIINTANDLLVASIDLTPLNAVNINLSTELDTLFVGTNTVDVARIRDTEYSRLPDITISIPSYEKILYCPADGLLYVTSLTYSMQAYDPGGNYQLVKSFSDLTGYIYGCYATGDGGLYVVFSGPMYRVSCAGISLADYASADELQSTAPDPGMYRVWPEGGMFRLGGNPAGLVTADVEQGATAADNTAAAIIEAILIRKGWPARDYSATDLADLATATSAETGVFIPPEVKNVSDILDEICRTVGAWWGFDAYGIFRVRRLESPTGTATITITEADIISIERQGTADSDKGIPVKKVTVYYDRNCTVQSSGLAGSVTADRKTWLAAEYRTVIAEDTTATEKHLLAPELHIYTNLSTKADAETEAARILSIYSVRRDRLEVRLKATYANLAVLDLFTLVNVQIDRIGYTSGKLMRVIGLDLDCKNGYWNLVLWG